MQYYDIFFDKIDLKVDENGNLTNPEDICIVEFNEDGEITNRVNWDGIPIGWDKFSPDMLDDLIHLGQNDDTLDEAHNRFDSWLNENAEWVEIYSQTYWEPAEYACAGIR